MEPNKKTKKQRIYVATYNLRDGGEVKSIRIKAVKKGNKFYALDSGKEIPFWAQIGLDNE